VRRFSMVVMIAIGMLITVALPAAASGEKAAIVVVIDDPICTVAGGGLSAQATLHGVFTSDGQWKLTCRGELSPGTEPDSAVVVRSTTADPIDICHTPYGVTYDWQVVFSASGVATITCHGVENSAHGGS
jgi:hypothetical protein